MNISQYIPACLLLVQIWGSCLAVASDDSNLEKLSQADEQYLAKIKEELQFDKWKAQSKIKTTLHFKTIEFEKFIPSNLKCIIEGVESDILTYRISCVGIGNDDRKINFKVYQFASFEQARHAVLRRFLNINVPFSVLRERWILENIDYGDINFGRNCWILGNLVFETIDGKAHSDLLDEIYKTIDNNISDREIDKNEYNPELGTSFCPTPKTKNLGMPDNKSHAQMAVGLSPAQVASEAIDLEFQNSHAISSNCIYVICVSVFIIMTLIVAYYIYCRKLRNTQNISPNEKT